MQPHIESLSWQYLRMYPLKDICWQFLQLGTMEYSEVQEVQRKILSQTVHHPLAEKFPPASSYTRLFIKALIAQVEESHQEVCEGLYGVYLELLAQPPSTSSGFCHRTYQLGGSGSITLKETCNLICDGTTGMCTWEASHVLARWCLEETERFQNKKILELGAGLGLMGITVVHTCRPASYTFTDLHEGVLKVLAENVRTNLSHQRPLEVHEGPTGSAQEEEVDWDGGGVMVESGETQVEVRRLDWAKGRSDLDVGVVLAADVVYDDEVTAHLVKMLKDLLRPGVDAYVASTLRNPHTYTFFKEALASCGLHMSSESQHQYQESPSQPQHSVAILHIVL